MTETATKPGTVSQPEKFRYTTPAEVEKYEKMLYKNYVRLGDDRKPAAEAKDFYYRIIGWHPSVPAITPGVETPSPFDSILVFQVQKYHRNVFVKKSVRDGNDVREEDQNKRVEMWKMEGDGSFPVVDPYGNFFKKAHEFVEQFAPDTM